MKTADELRRELDGGANITVLRPKADAERAGGRGVRRAGARSGPTTSRSTSASPGLVDGLLDTTGMTVIYGESGSGKTFVALDVACHVAAGLPWHGMEVEQGVVVYVAAESPESVKRRVWAWKRRHGVEHLPLVVVTATVDLLNGSADKLIALLGRIRERHGRIALVVVDTLARAMTGNENAPDDMGKFVAACGRIRDACEGHVLVVHHCGKDVAKGARGHSSLRAATDTELEVTNGPDGGAVRGDEAPRRGRRPELRLHARGGRAGRERQGPRGHHLRGGRVRSARPATDRKRRPPGKNEQVVLDALAAAIVDHGREPPPAPDIPRNVKVVTVEEWREKALRYLIEPAEPKRKAEAVGRAIKSLSADHFVLYVGGHVWLPSGRMGSREAACDRAGALRERSHGRVCL